MSKRETVIVELKLTGTRLQLRNVIAEIRQTIEDSAADTAAMRGGFGFDAPSTLELVSKLNHVRDLDYLVACKDCEHCQHAKIIITELRERLEEVW